VTAFEARPITSSHCIEKEVAYAKRTISILLILALVVAVMAVGPAAMAKKGKGKAKGKEKVTLCHNAGQPDQQTIRVGKPAAKAHFAHGDTPGACQPLPPPQP